MTESQRLVEKYLNLAKKELLKEGEIDEKAKIIQYIKQLLAAGLDKSKLEPIVNFYKFSLDSSKYEYINSSTFEEIMSKLNDIAQKESIILPQN